MCHVALCDHKLSVHLGSRQCTINNIMRLTSCQEEAVSYESKLVLSNCIITAHLLTLDTYHGENHPAPALVDQLLQPFHHQTPARIGKGQSTPSFLCNDKSPGLSFRYGNGLFISDTLYAVGQSQRTAPSDQSQQWGLTERRGLERLILRTSRLGII